MYEKFKQYKESTIYSMSNLELLLLLYDEAVKRLKMAQIALEGLAGNGIQMGHMIGAGRHAGTTPRATVGIDMDDVLLVQPHGVMLTGTKTGGPCTMYAGHEAQGQADLALGQSGRAPQLTA